MPANPNDDGYEAMSKQGYQTIDNRRDVTWCIHLRQCYSGEAAIYANPDHSLLELHEISYVTPYISGITGNNGDIGVRSISTEWSITEWNPPDLSRSFT